MTRSARGRPRSARLWVGTYPLPCPLRTRIMDVTRHSSLHRCSWAISHPWTRSGRLPECPAVLPDATKAPECGGIDREPQHELLRMTDDAPGHLDESPADRRDGVRGPGRGTGEALEPDEQIVGEYAQPEEDRVRPDVPAGHPLQPEAGLEFFVEVLRLPALVVPAEDRARGLQLAGPVAGDRMVDVALLVKEIGLAPPGAFDNEAKGVRTLIHGMDRLRNLVATAWEG